MSTPLARWSTGRQVEVLAAPGVTRLAEARLGPKPVVLVRLEPR